MAIIYFLFQKTSLGIPDLPEVHTIYVLLNANRTIVISQGEREFTQVAKKS